MGKKLSVPDASAYEALDRLLFREWDPIGVSNAGGPDNEYRDYLPGFWALVTRGAIPLELADYLGRVERDHMGLQTSDEHRLDIATKAVVLVDAWRMRVRG